MPGTAGPHGPSAIVFLAQIVAMLVTGRLMGEFMQRLGQPAVMGQLIGGIVLGPSVLGLLWPGLQHALFPAAADQKAMLDGIAQLGILMLLLLTGMETDLSVFRRSRGTAAAVSVAGIAVPFACGIGLGRLLPDALLPDPGRRLITTLFFATALSISSVKVVATVVREVGFLRRTLGQVIVAAAVIDDTIGWIIVSLTFGLALKGRLDPVALAGSVLGTAIFLTVSFTLGRRLVFWLICWANDTFVSEMPVITTILVITGGMALITSLIGVHAVLGAFVAGILVGQSPILTRHIYHQLRGLIVALFMPLFFGLAGLSTNLALLGDPGRLHLAVGLIAIVASVGLSMGALNQDLFTMIVAMAVVTTVSMPPMLRWALARLPMTPEEQARLERLEFEASGFVPGIERLLAAVDASPSGQFASRLVGLLAGAHRILATVLHLDAGSAAAGARRAEHTAAAVREGVEAASEGRAADTDPEPADITTRLEGPDEETIVVEARKGYDALFIGREPASEGASFHPQITRSASSFAGTVAIVVARDAHRQDPAAPALHILVPLTGTLDSQHGAELAFALAHASRGSVTALHVTDGQPRRRSWKLGVGAASALAASAEAIMREIVRGPMGSLYFRPPA